MVRWPFSRKIVEKAGADSDPVEALPRGQPMSDLGRRPEVIDFPLKNWRTVNFEKVRSLVEKLDLLQRTAGYLQFGNQEKMDAIRSEILTDIKAELEG